MSTNLIDFTVARGALLPALSATLTDDNGPVLIQGATATLTLTDAAGAVALSAAATVLDDGTAANRGKLKYDWLTGDTGVAGVYRAVWTVTAGGRSQQFPMRPVQPFMLILIV